MDGYHIAKVLPWHASRIQSWFFVNWFMYVRLRAMCVPLLPRNAAPHRTSNGRRDLSLILNARKNGCTRCSGVCLCMCDDDVRRVAIVVFSNENNCMLSQHRDYDPNGARELTRIRTCIVCAQSIHFNSIKMCRWKMEAESSRSKSIPVYMQLAIGSDLYSPCAGTWNRYISVATDSNMGMVTRCACTGCHGPSFHCDDHLSRLSVADMTFFFCLF